MCFYKRAVLDLFNELGLNYDLDLRVMFSTLETIKGFAMEDKPRRYSIFLDRRTDEEMAVDMGIIPSFWARLNGSFWRNSGFTEAQILSVNHVFFHEAFHIKSKFMGWKHTEKEEQLAQQFAVRKTQEIVNGTVYLTVLWPANDIDLYHNSFTPQGCKARFHQVLDV